MKKKLLTLVAFSALTMLSACGQPVNSSSAASSAASSASSQVVSSNVSSTVSSTKSSTAASSEAASSAVSSETSSASSSISSEVLPDPDPVPTDPTELPEGSVTRVYNEAEDLMVDDFSSATPKGVLADGAVYNASPYLKVRINSSNPVFPSSADASIYKQGEGTYPIKDYDGIGFRMKLDDAKKIAKDHLVLALRGDDACKVYEIPLSEAVDPDGTALNDFNGEYQDFIISPKQTIADENTVYTKNDGTPSTIKVLDTIVGFHFYAKGICDATLDIASVFLVKGAQKTVLDDFEHEKPNAASPNLWWRDSTGTIVGREVHLDKGASYTIPVDASKENVVLNIKGDTSNTDFYVDGTGGEAHASWGLLRDKNSNLIPAALKGVYAPIAINLAASSVTISGITAISIRSSSPITINKVFFSDLTTKAASPYPGLNALTQDITVFDSFNRSQSGINADYDASHASDIVKNAGLDYVLSYNTGTASMVSVNGSAAVFDATSLAANDFIQLKEGSDAHARVGQQYLVFSIKMEGGATLDNFRFNYGGAGVKYMNDCYASFGTKSTATPYVNAEKSDYTWYVIDLKETGITNTDNSLDMYYSGTGKLSIDEIFFADHYLPSLAIVNANVNPDIKDVNVPLDAGYKYQYGGYLGNPSAPVIGLTLHGDGTATLATIRLELNGTTLWFKDKVIFDTKGNPIDGAAVLPTTDTTIYIDLIKSGFPTGTDGNLHIHCGGDGGVGSITFTSLASYAYSAYTISRLDAEKACDVSGYSYVGWLGNQATFASEGKKYLLVQATGDGSATLGSLRIEDKAGNTYWVKDKQIILADGTTMAEEALDATGKTYLIDLTATGITFQGDVHVHIGGVGTGTVTLKKMNVIYENEPYGEIFNGHYSA